MTEPVQPQQPLNPPAPPAQESTPPSTGDTAGPAEHRKPFSALAITAFVFAVIAALLSWVPIVNNIAFLIAGIGLVFACFAIHATRAKGARRGKALAVAALVVSLVAGGLVLGTQSVYGKAVDDAFGTNSDTSDTAKPKKSKAKIEKKTTSKVQDMEGDVDGSNYHVRLDSLTRTVNDYEGKPTVMLTYDLTNNKKENSNMFDVNVTVFQNGHQLSTTVYSDQTPDGYDAESLTRTLQPGATGTVTEGYVLEDETNPVTVEVTGTMDSSGLKVTHEFALQ